MQNKNRPRGRRVHFRRLTALVAGAAALAGCASIERAAISSVADSMTGQGTTFTGDDDPAFIQDAIPFGLKLYETLLERAPEHDGLMISLAQGYAAYAFMLQQDGDFASDDDRDEARVLRERASKHFLRSRGYALRALNTRYPGFEAGLESDLAGTLAQTSQKDASALYWAGAAWSGAVNAARENLSLMAELRTAAALVTRVLELDETFENGAAHAFMISYEGGRPGGSTDAAREHYKRALELSGRRSAGVYTAFAESIVVKEQDLEEFNALLDAALAIDPNAVVSLRLQNTLAQQRARWLRERIPDLFLLPEDEDSLSLNSFENSAADVATPEIETDDQPDNTLVTGDMGGS